MEPDTEIIYYPDTGCEVAPACLECPLSQCRFDAPAWYLRLRWAARDFLVWRARYEDGLTAGEAAAKFSKTERSIHRAVVRFRRDRAEWGFTRQDLMAVVPVAKA